MQPVPPKKNPTHSSSFTPLQKKEHSKRARTPPRSSCLSLHDLQTSRQPMRMRIHCDLGQSQLRGAGDKGARNYSTALATTAPTSRKPFNVKRRDPEDINLRQYSPHRVVAIARTTTSITDNKNTTYGTPPFPARRLRHRGFGIPAKSTSRLTASARTTFPPKCLGLGEKWKIFIFLEMAPRSRAIPSRLAKK